jgi:phosphatidylserine/phosphatidylglycerophosphate/cardiolipin synthase-like enzyme/uncharacterized membrane protein YdjX (TVP38/TMEM64 family)
MTQQPILKTGRNCWRVRSAEQVAFLVDGADYFDTLIRSLHQARRQVLILSWDIYSRLRLEGSTPTGAAPELGELLNRLATRERDLRIHILNWDFSMLFALDREWAPIYRLDWKTHGKVRFEMDDDCPAGGSHHQKVVVIDDRIAFCGGLDLTRGRWDTPAHRPNDPQRNKVDGTRGRPYHDVQMAVTGQAAAALGDLARERWRLATGEQLPRPTPPPGDVPNWHSGRPDMENVQVAIVRTVPDHNGYTGVREVEQLFLDAIAAAREYIYIENQYFTAGKVARALRKRLDESRGPEIILNLPLCTVGWLSSNTMDIIRVHLIEELRSADRHNRFAVYYPAHDTDAAGESINLHAKVMIVDDRLVRVGSANLNNRSMGMDTECDLAVEALQDQEHTAASIRAFRNRLLGEHLAVPPARVEEAAQQEGSLIAAIESLRGTGRTLAPLEPVLEKDSQPILDETQLVDPERPVDSDTLLEQFVPEKKTRSAGLRLLGWMLFLGALLGLAAAWRMTPLGEALDISRLSALITDIRGWSGTPLILIATFVIAGSVLIPLTALVIATVVVFGPLAGFLYSILGAVASALTSYVIGARLGRRSIRRMAGSRVNAISRRLARRGLLTVIVVRMVPVAPFTVVNLVAGASHISFRDFFIGTVLGLLPGTLAIALLVDRVSASLREPNATNLLTLMVVAVAVIAATFVLSRHLLQRSADEKQEQEDKATRPS